MFVYPLITLNALYTENFGGDFVEFLETLINIFKKSIMFDHKYLSFMLYFAIIISGLTLIHYLSLFKKYKSFISLLIEETDKNEGIEHRINNINEKMIDKKSRKINRIWQRFYNEYLSERNETIPDPLYYFNTDELVHKAGHRKLIEIIPASFVSIGLLGTFLGIVFGVSELNTRADSEAMRQGVDSLLAGMSLAFESSILGIILSLLYQFGDRMFAFRKLQQHSDLVLEQLDKTIPIETEVSLLDQVAKAQETQMNDFKTFLTNQLLPTLTSGISESISTAITPQLTKSNEILEKVAQNTLDAQSDSLNEMVNHFVQSLNEITGNQVEELGLALQKAVEWQEKVHEQLNGLVNELINAAREQVEMAEKTTLLSEQINSYTVKLTDFQDNLINTTSELEQLTNVNSSLLEDVNEIYEKLTEQNNKEAELFEQRLVTLNNTVEEITSLSNSFTVLNEEMNGTMRALVDTTDQLYTNVEQNQNLTNTLIQQHEISNEWSIKTHELLEDITQNIGVTENLQSTLNNLIQMVSDEKVSIKNLQQQYSEMLTSSVEKLSHLWSDNSELLSASQSQLTNLNENLNSSMENFAEHMHRGIQNTFEQFDEELQKAVGYLATGVESINVFVNEMEATIGKVESQLKMFNASVSQFSSTLENKVIVNE